MLVQSCVVLAKFKAIFFRYNDIPLEEREMRIRDMIAGICSTAPLVEGHGLRRSPSMGSIVVKANSGRGTSSSTVARREPKVI